ncbi:hypothetical protein D9M68_175650 [compost metagenome]
MDRGGDGYPTRFGEALDARRHIDAVAIDVAVFKQDVADVDPDAKFYPAIRAYACVSAPHTALDLDSAENCVFHRTELHQHTVADELDDTPMMRGDLDIPKLLSMSHQGRKRTLLVDLHQPAITGNVRGHDDG